ncbi:MAG: Rieske 2Fe-2S domain-containing protein [Burkholderiales bacterium]|nr:Rieske 2Fe-2S domain-containing protein [Burkholderiales bacterium]
MSDALTYLVKARPDAVGHYFAFLKNCGKHLDPKTRDLISLITKVHAQTERGFRQYLGRALRDGCTPMEVLDALLMAFPALGLTKIVWAVDIILAMDLPDFQPGALHGPGGEGGEWHDVMAADELAPGETTRVECDGRGLFVHRVQRAADTDAGAATDAGSDDDTAEWRVYDSRCPHQTTNIPHLALSGHTLTCPKHEWVFDIRSGACVAKGTSPLKRWPGKIVDGRLLAHW